MASTAPSTDLNDLLTSLEGQVRRAAQAVHRLKTENARLTRELASVTARAAEWQKRSATWERERDSLGARLERLLTDLDHLAHAHEGTESSHDLEDRDR
jgi:chromosome segregation ATPase